MEKYYYKSKFILIKILNIYYNIFLYLLILVFFLSNIKEYLSNNIIFTTNKYKNTFIL